ncbi:ketosynthase chain-length factor [Streptomyces sp. I05A-00742]|uniref:ketosynthase chain-length factor n=1 Tax=Streptomyces sp. I05A-00742 TaxID=2732853 RepID=UPI001489E85F|nr:ketosynthase chain-length factor [Streptomyces sp. I05A-00742]
MSTPTVTDDRTAPAAAGRTTGRAVVTGLGVLAPNGLSAEAYWEAVLAGRNGIRRITRFDPAPYPSVLAGEITDYRAEDHIPSRLLPQTDHVTRLSLTAGEAALADAGVDPAELDEYGAGVVTASSAGGFEFGQRELQALWSKGGSHVSAYQSFAWFYAVNTGQLSIRHGMRGPSGVLVSEQAGGLDAIAQARRQLRKGIGLLLTGAVDGSLCPWGWTAQLAGGGLSTRTDPARAYLPFDQDANGFVPGEGGAVLVLEEAGAAAARGARVYGEIAGYAATFDPRPGSGRPPGLRRAVELALVDAGVAPADVDVVFADAAGTPEADRAEAEALAAVFGPGGVPVTAPKTLTGRLNAGGAALDVATALLALRDGVVPPTAHVTRPAWGGHIALVTGAPLRAPLRHALVLARGRGGFNTALLVRGTA